MTKIVDTLVLDKSQQQKIKMNNIRKIIHLADLKVTAEFQEIKEYVRQYFNHHTRLYIPNKKVWYDKRIWGIMANIEDECHKFYQGKTSPSNVVINDIAGLSGELMSWQETARFFNTSGDYQIKYHGNTYDGIIYSKDGVMYRFVTYDHCAHAKMGENGNREGCNYMVWPVHHFHGVDCSEQSAAQILFDLFQYDLVPADEWFKGNQRKNSFLKLKELYTNNKPLFTVKDDAITLNERAAYAAAVSKVKPFFLTDEQYKAIHSDDIYATSDDIADFINDLLMCDNARSGLDPYDPNIIEDPNRGHWDLWDYGFDVAENEKAGELILTNGLVARDPADDINSGIVAIDFGTKSTVVVYKNEYSDILPLQVGSGNYNSGVQVANYENPTIVQFIDIENFMKMYKARQGRPFTRIEDITVSHSAMSNLNVNHDSKNYYTFFSELKQYCGTRGQRVKLRDTKENVYDLPTYMELMDDDIDPIEIYAYYLGLYINNMLQQKHIFMHYLMSFPVKYERNIREKLLRSFKRGIKKSLPTALLNNEEAMKRFKVEEGVTEPAAYACTALLEYGFAPEGEDTDYYGVFDFGGGTTDFDFGVLEELDDGRNDYLLTHFGENGDRTLGGENILKLLAFNIFVENYDNLIAYSLGSGSNDKVKLPFPMIADGWEFAGNEAIIRTSQEAHQNMHNLMEKLRPVWEEPNSDVAQKIINGNKIEVDLFDEKGLMHPNVNLEFTSLDLAKIIRDRIEAGVKNFFISMKQAFESTEVDNLSDVAEFAIFLGGNSSKAEVVRELFNEYIEGKAKEVMGITDDEHLPAFKIYPPLGTKEADEILAALNEEENEEYSEEDNLERPTGKTGVAYGLLYSYGNSEIKVESILPNNSIATPFQFYVGKNKKRKFNTILSRGADYNTWVKFIDASDDFDLLYTEVPEAATNKAPVTIAKRYHVVLEKPDADKFVFIKPCTSNAISYFVATDESECKKPADGAEPIKIELS